MLVSDVQQSDSFIYTCLYFVQSLSQVCVCVCVCIYVCVFVCIYIYILFHYGLLQNIECNSLYYTVGPC